MHYLAKLDRFVEKGQIPPKLGSILRKFYFNYCSAFLEHGRDFSKVEPMLLEYLDQVVIQLENPYPFSPFHRRITGPFNYYQFALDFIRPLVVFERSRILGMDNVDKIEAQISNKENVILFANHQIEPDPQAIQLLMEKTHPQLVPEIIFVAGHRVTTDPLAVPLSKGCNLLCIYSKKYLENPPELKEEKVMHNQKTLKMMGELLHEGGKCIYVAPSGGRDRPNSQGVVEVAPFDPQSIEFFYLMARKADRPTHFYPLSLMTYNLLPPPDSIEVELGEQRQPKCTPIHLAFGDEINMDSFAEKEQNDKKVLRSARAEYIWNIVNDNYVKLTKE